MLTPKVGERMLRITPPEGSSAGYCQMGKVESFDDEIIVVVVLVDGPRHMRFRRKDGFDTSGLGTFLVRPDY